MDVVNMRLTSSETEILQVLIGKRAFRIFCPPPSIYFNHLEGESYTIWLNSQPDFVNFFALEVEESRCRLAVERGPTPRGFRYKAGVVSECCDIFKKSLGPSTIRRIKIYERNDTDSALVFEYAEDGGSFVLTAGIYAHEVCYFWDFNESNIGEDHTLRVTID